MQPSEEFRPLPHIYLNAALLLQEPRGLGGDPFYSFASYDCVRGAHSIQYGYASAGMPTFEVIRRIRDAPKRASLFEQPNFGFFDARIFEQGGPSWEMEKRAEAPRPSRALPNEMMSAIFLRLKRAFPRVILASASKCSALTSPRS